MDDTGSMSSVHTVLLPVWLQWLFISRALGFNGLHASVGRKSPDSTQVCSPVSSKGLWRMKSVWWKRELDLSAPFSTSSSSTHRDEFGSTEKWCVGPRQDTPINVMMPQDVFESSRCLSVTAECGSGEYGVDSKAETQRQSKWDKKCGFTLSMFRSEERKAGS